MIRWNYAPKPIGAPSKCPIMKLLTETDSNLCEVNEAALYPFSISEDALMILLLVKNILSLLTLRLGKAISQSSSLHSRKSFQEEADKLH